LNPEKPKSGAAQPASILVVDDTPANLQVLAGMLKDRGYKVRPVPSGKLALLAAGRDPPDLILLDINMPEMDGYEVCEHLKADDKLRGIPIIFISALTEPLDKVKAFAIGGVDYITKPFQMEELHARVETHLKLRRLQIELEQYSRHLELARERLKLDLELARKVQRGFLPQRMPEVTGYEFFGYYESAYEIGGDYYDFIPLPGPRLGIMVGDVAGKGMPAALLMAKVSSDARFCTLTEPHFATAITQLNTHTQEAGMLDRFVTLIACELDPARHIITFVNAGHPAPLVYRREKNALEEGTARHQAGLPLGVDEGPPYEAVSIELTPGDCVLLYTDGVTDAKNKDDHEFHMPNVMAALKAGPQSPKPMVERLVAAIKQHSLGCKQFDDITVVAFGRQA
jgi:phosphoserine phosphatase RsbU/P